MKNCGALRTLRGARCSTVNMPSPEACVAEYTWGPPSRGRGSDCGAGNCGVPRPPTGSAGTGAPELGRAQAIDVPEGRGDRLAVEGARGGVAPDGTPSRAGTCARFFVRKGCTLLVADDGDISPDTRPQRTCKHVKLHPERTKHL